VDGGAVPTLAGHHTVFTGCVFVIGLFMLKFLGRPT